MKNILKYLLVPVAIIRLILVCLATLIFMPIYLLLCPYAHNDDLAYVDHMNYIHHFEDLL